MQCLGKLANISEPERDRLKANFLYWSPPGIAPEIINGKLRLRRKSRGEDFEEGIHKFHASLAHHCCGENTASP
jgi:hypothetical protein